MDQAHFKEDYDRHVTELQEKNAGDPELAMAQAIGSPTVAEFRRQGDQQAHIMIEEGLLDGHSLYDFACGSGRTAAALHRAGWNGDYLGVDVVPALIAALMQACPDTYQAKIHTDLSIAAESDSLDMVCAWSIFTHLYAVESFIYLRDIHRALKPDGKLVMSFLEFGQPTHWTVFDQNVERKLQDARAPLDAFIARSDLIAWCDRIGFTIDRFIDGMDETATPFGNVGQSVAILRK